LVALDILVGWCRGLIPTIRIGVLKGARSIEMQTGDTVFFSEFGTLAEEIKSLRLVPRRVSFHLCLGTKNTRDYIVVPAGEKE